MKPDRYKIFSGKWSDEQRGMLSDPDGEWVRFEDHEQALLTARQEGRKEAFEEAAKIAEADNRSDMAKATGHKPDWFQYAVATAAAIRSLEGK